MAQGEHYLISRMEDQIRKRRARTHATGDGARANSSHPATRSIRPTVERLAHRTAKFILGLESHLNLARDWGQAIVGLNRF